MEDLDEVAARIRGFLPWRLRKGSSTNQDAAEAGGARVVLSKEREVGACKEVIQKELTSTYSTSPS